MSGVGCASEIVSSTSSPSTRLSMGSTPRTTSARSSTSGRIICRRLKASSCRVRSRARWPAIAICSASARSGSSGESASIIIALYERMIESRLLKSCAMPPASLHLLRLAQLLLAAPQGLLGALAHGDLLAQVGIEARQLRRALVDAALELAVRFEAPLVGGL